MSRAWDSIQQAFGPLAVGEHTVQQVLDDAGPDIGMCSVCEALDVELDGEDICHLCGGDP